MSDSVGDIFLDLNIDTSGLEEDIEQLAEKIGSDLQNLFEGTFDSLKQSQQKLDGSLKQTRKCVEKEVETAGENIKNSFEQNQQKLNDSLKQTRKGAEKEVETAGKNIKKSFLGNISSLISKAQKESTSISKNLSKNFLSSAANIKAAFDMAIGTVKTFISSVKGLMSANQTQIEVEARLAATMRNTTGATEEQVQSIKNLAGELQVLGVVGDEVQLAGMQELATYVENVDSLKTMLPVLDDMIAQQYGYNASTDSAVTISTMLGKVLQGQTSALSRYGYSFTEAQEQLLKYGTEEQRVATLAAVVSESVGGVNAALANTPTGKMKQLSNDFGDLKETLGSLVTNVLYPIVKYLDVIVVKLNNVFATVNENLQNLFGITNDFAGGTGVVDILDSIDDVPDTIDQTTEAAKKLKKAVAGFDQLNILSENDEESDDTAAATAAVAPTVDTSKANTAVNSFINKIKDRLEDFFKPIKNSWDKYGKPVISAWDNALQSIKKLVIDIGAAFVKAWKSDSAQKLIDTIFKSLATLGGIIDSISTAFDNAWNDNGNGEKLIESYFKKLNSVLSIINTIGENFKKAWDSDNTGKKIFSNILQSITNVNNGLANLGDNLDKALQSPSGQESMEKILDIIESITSHTKTLTDNFREWSETLNFQPLIDSFNDLLDPIKDIVDNCLDGLNSFVKNVVQPIAKWTVEEAVPKFFDTLGIAFGVIAKVGKSVGDILKNIWDYFLKYVVNFACDAFITFMDLLNGFLDAVLNNSTVIAILEAIAVAIGVIVGVIEAFNIAQAIANALLLANPIGLIITSIIALIAIITVAITYWDEIVAGFQWFIDRVVEGCEIIGKYFSDLWDSICKIFSGIGDWFKEKFEKAWKNIQNAWSGVKEFFKGIWKGICSIFSNIGIWFKNKFNNAWNGIKNAWSGVGKFFEGMWKGIKNTFSNVTNWFKDTFSKAWSAVKNVFSSGGKIFDGIKDGILNAFKVVVNGIIDGLNWVIAQPFNGINTALSSIKGVDIMGYKPFDWIQTISVPQIPKLAKGGLVTAPTLALVGDNKNAYSDPEVVAPLSKLKTMINDEQQSGGSNVEVYLQKIISLLSSEETTHQNNIYLDSELIERQLVKVRKRKSRRCGGAV